MKIIISIFFFAQIAFLFPVDELDQISKNKLISCLTVVKLTTKNRKDLFDELIDFAINYTGGHKREKEQKLSAMFLLLCYSKVTKEQSDTINQNPIAVDVTSEDIKNLSLIDLVYDIYKSQDTDGIKQFHKQVHNIILKLSTSEKGVFDTNYNNLFKHSSQFNRLFGLDFFKMNTKTKNLMGIAAIILFLISLGYLIKKLMSLNKTHKEKKKQ